MKIIKEWVEHYYEDLATGMFLINPKNKDKFIEHSIECHMIKEEHYLAIFKTESNGPIASGETEDECMNTFKEMYAMCILVKSLMYLSIKELTDLTLKIILKYPEYVSQYKQGNVGLIGLFVGEVMKCVKGKADPKMLMDIVTKELNAV